MATAGDSQRVGGNIFRDGGARGDVGAVADIDGSDERGIAAYEYPLTDTRGILFHAVVVASDGSGADIRIAAYRGVAEIRKMHGLHAFAEDAFFHFHKIADARARTHVSAFAKMGERTDD